MNTIDITMTATLRPDILDRTLSSFCEKMLVDRSRFRLIINIDCLGENVEPKNVLEIPRKYFDDILFNISKEPCFSKAVIWCWKNVTTDFCINLEDDWVLLQKIDINDMIKIMETYRDLASLRLSKDPIQKSKFGIENGFVYYPKISLNPILFRGSFVKKIVNYMDPSLNPEKQLRPSKKSKRGRIISTIINGIYVSPSFQPLVKDIGREWMNSSIFTKEIGFTYWKIK